MQIDGSKTNLPTYHLRSEKVIPSNEHIQSHFASDRFYQSNYPEQLTSDPYLVKPMFMSTQNFYPNEGNVNVTQSAT